LIKIEFGNSFVTDAVVDINYVKVVPQTQLPEFIAVNQGENFSISYGMKKKDIVFGLGENVGGMNKRGGIYESFCFDEFNHTPDKKSLYAAHNLIIVDGERKFGLFIDHPGKVRFDVGFTDIDTLEISMENPNFNLYIITGNSLKEIVKKFRKAIGISYIPPKWAFGFQQSRWSYPDMTSITEIADKFRNSQIPCDTIYMDIDYMDNYKNFTIDKAKFPEFSEFVKFIKNKGFRLIPIIDAGCKKEKGYDISDEGIENGYYCLDKDGKPFVGAVWPGHVYFPDFMNSKVRTWFGDKYKILIDQGIEGFWNDMNEPAIFYSEGGIKKAFEKIKSMEGKNIGVDLYFQMKDTMEGISHSIEDYKSFYHNVDGELINHYDLHNLYGYNMTRAAGESFVKNYPDKRILLFSRASYVGMHRYGGIWTGDNKSWWEHLLLNIKMMPSINMLGFLYSGADVGGFGCDASAELVIRWTQFGVFTPLLRNHTTLGTRAQEPFAFDVESTDIFRSAINLRYALIPYIYSEFMKAAKESECYFKSLAYEFSDDISRRVEDQVLVGDSVMLAPIYTPNTFSRNVWMPEDMLLWKVGDYTDFNYSLHPKGHHFIDIELDEIPLFIRKNKILVIGNHSHNIDSIDQSEITVIAYVQDLATYRLYNDDGVTTNYMNGDYTELDITIKIQEDSKPQVLTNLSENSIIKKINYLIVNSKGQLFKL